MTTLAGAATILPVEQIHLNVCFQPRLDVEDETPYHEKHVKQLVASDPEQWPPLLVTPNAEGSFDVVDGFHRLEAAKRLGIHDLPCVIVPNADYDTCFEANMRHGLPLTTEDRKAYARWLREQQPELSEVEISKRTGLSRNTVRKALGKRPVQREQRGDLHQQPTDPINKSLYTIMRLPAPPTATDVQSFINEYADTADIAEHFATFGEALIKGAKPFLG